MHKLALVMVAFVAGCGSKGDSAGAGTSGSGSGSGGTGCDYANYGGSGMHVCWTWSWSGYDFSSVYASQCSQAKGTAITACSQTDAVGKCTFSATANGYTIATTVFYYKPTSAADAEKGCKANNNANVTATWTAF